MPRRGGTSRLLPDISEACGILNGNIKWGKWGRQSALVQSTYHGARGGHLSSLKSRYTSAIKSVGRIGCVRSCALACVRACVRACARARVRACAFVRVCLRACAWAWACACACA
eukprot:2879944-Pleurochrysis_carterae.AAC.1